MFANYVLLLSFNVSLITFDYEMICNCKLAFTIFVTMAF